MAIDNPQYPDDMGIYDTFNWPGDVPKVPLKQLTKKQAQRVMTAYRFGGYRPGSYQGPTFSGKGGLTP